MHNLHMSTHLYGKRGAMLCQWLGSAAGVLLFLQHLLQPLLQTGAKLGGLLLGPRVAFWSFRNEQTKGACKLSTPPFSF